MPSPFLLNLYLAVIHSPSFDLFLILLQYHIVFGWEKKIIFKLEKGGVVVSENCRVVTMRKIQSAANWG